MNMDANENDNAHDVERWLDDALAQYAKAEPRVGLESRILARLSAEQRTSRNLRWWGALAFTVAGAIALVLPWPESVNPRLIPEAPVAKNSAPLQEGESVRRGDGAPAGTVAKVSRVKRSRREFANARLNPAPKQDRFPSTSPLTDQERMLALYVQDFPEKAALVARAQTELRKLDELQMAAPWPGKAEGTLEQQE